MSEYFGRSASEIVCPSINDSSLFTLDTEEFHDQRHLKATQTSPEPQAIDFGEIQAEHSCVDKSAFWTKHRNTIKTISAFFSSLFLVVFGALWAPRLHERQWRM
ncbi:unnamed protein product, partial [Mesorhabditis belari]|uniref:Uncharacterized protein n=1 Tax=Mesorhabditis belari TaxID=2138241 RepID=A0AAF3FQ37_9BILA